MISGCGQVCTHLLPEPHGWRSIRHRASQCVWMLSSETVQGPGCSPLLQMHLLACCLQVVPWLLVSPQLQQLHARPEAHPV